MPPRSRLLLLSGLEFGAFLQRVLFRLSNALLLCTLIRHMRFKLSPIEQARATRANMGIPRMISPGGYRLTATNTNTGIHASAIVSTVGSQTPHPITNFIQFERFTTYSCSQSIHRPAFCE